MSMPTCPSCIYASGVCKKTGVPIRRSTGCTYHTPKPQTNADRIRAMSDKELAKFLYEETDYPKEEYWLDWLKQEAEI